MKHYDKKNAIKSKKIENDYYSISMEDLQKIEIGKLDDFFRQQEDNKNDIMIS